MKKSKWIFDLETYKYMFLATFYNIDTHEWYEFEISARMNQTTELREFLKNVMLIGFNNINFDYPVLHHTILSNNERWTSEEIYIEANKIIKSKYSAIWDNQTKIPQLDLFKIWHYDNKNKSTSLKWLEFAMRMENVQDLPYPPNAELTYEQMDEIKSYCRNDVIATYKFYLKSLNNIDLRVHMTKELNHNVMNYSDVKIGEYLNRVTYQRLSGIKWENFKNLQTERYIIPIKDLIPDFIKFKTKPLQDFLTQIKTESINANVKGDWEKSLQIGDMSINFAKGGLHSEDKSRIITCKEGYYLKEKDVGSMYPKAIISGNYYPEHLGEYWNKGIELLYNERNDELKPLLKKLEYKSTEYNSVNSKQEVYKLAMNGGGYGKTGSEHGWQKDKLVMFKVTFKGQLSLLMLLEEYYLLGGVELISANTDGIVIHYPKDIDDKVKEIHTNWEEITNSILEDTFYEKIVFRDVNSYIAFIVDENNNHLKYKYKGAFEIDRDFHKNHSKRIVPLALANYFINNIPVDNTIKTHLQNNHFNAIPYGFAENYGIYDFCLGAKMTNGNILYARSHKGTSINDEELFKVTRYYVSNDGVELIKKLPALEKAYIPDTAKQPINQVNIFDFIEDTTLVEPEDRETNIESGYKCTVFNQYKEGPYNINYDYYINECNKIINIINQ